MKKEIEFKVAGVTYGHRQGYLMHIKKVGGVSKISFIREKSNQDNVNAIKVLAVGLDGKKLHIGYVPKSVDQILAPVMDNGGFVSATSGTVIGGVLGPERSKFGFYVKATYEV